MAVSTEIELSKELTISWRHNWRSYNNLHVGLLILTVLKVDSCHPQPTPDRDDSVNIETAVVITVMYSSSCTVVGLPYQLQYKKAQLTQREARDSLGIQYASHQIGPHLGLRSNINVIYTSLKSTFSALQFPRW